MLYIVIIWARQLELELQNRSQWPVLITGSHKEDPAKQIFTCCISRFGQTIKMQISLLAIIQILGVAHCQETGEQK